MLSPGYGARGNGWATLSVFDSQGILDEVITLAVSQSDLVTALNHGYEVMTALRRDISW